MSQVQSATAEPAKVTARGRQTVADPIPAPATPAEADVNFASVFAMTRESAWMDSLRSRQGEAAARHAQQGRTRKAVGNDSKSDTARQARRDEESQSSSRSERLKETDRRDRSAEADQAQESKQQSVEEARDRQAERSADKHHAERQESLDAKAQDARMLSEGQPTVPPAAECTAASQQGQARPTVQTLVQTPVQTPASQADASRSPLAAGSTTSASGGPTPTLQMSVPAPAPPEAPGAQVVSTAEPLSTSISPISGKGEAGPKAQQDLTGAATAAKAGDGAPKTAASSDEFQSLLQQVGRERAAVVRQAVTAAGKGAPDESVRLTKSEAIDQLARVVRSSLGGKTSSMTLRLDPPELGQLRVDIRMQDHAVVLRFQADTQAARDLLDTRLSDLRHALEQHGIRLDRADVEIRPPSPSGPQGREADGQLPQQHNLPQGGESGFGQARGQQGGGNGSQESGSSAGLGAETWTGFDASALQGLTADGAGATAETGVDLVV